MSKKIRIATNNPDFTLVFYGTDRYPCKSNSIFISPFLLFIGGNIFVKSTCVVISLV